MTQVPVAGSAPVGTGGEQRRDEILMSFAGSAPQRRLTVLVRMILAVPHLVVLYALDIAGSIVIFISWFAALFAGRLPAWAADFLTGWLRWSARVSAYLWLLTDQYPPFALAEAGYPVQVAVRPGPLNRLAVLFRVILMIPAGIVAGLAVWGMAGIGLLVTWVIVLISGRMPEALYQAVAAIVRYQVRYTGYGLMLTGTYPGGLFGDRADGPAGGAESAPAWGNPPAPASGDPQPSYGEGGGQAYGTLTAPAPVPPPAAPAPLAAAAPAGVPQSWRLVLSSGARKLVGLFLALGLLSIGAYVAVIVLLVPAGNPAQTRADAVRTVSRAHATLTSTMRTLEGQVAACGNNLTCVTREEVKASQAFRTFDAVLVATPMPDSASTAANGHLERDTTRVATDFQRLSAATSVPQYQQIAAGSGLQQTLSQFDTDYQQLGITLGATRQ